jgi:hypothetical protein
MFLKIIVAFTLMQNPGTAVKYVNLAAHPPVELAELWVRGSEVKGCAPGFSGTVPRPPEVCYPFPVAVKIIAFMPGAGFTKASLVVRVTNSGKGPVVLPVGITPTPPRGAVSYLHFIVNLENIASFMGFASAYADTGAPATFATIQPGESIEYEIPVEIEKLKQAVASVPDAALHMVVRLSSSRLERRANGELISVTDSSQIPSGMFEISHLK